jgi:DNA-directed RNA polymerase specialized sigma24 family protein
VARREVWRLEDVERRQRELHGERPAYHAPIDRRHDWLEALGALAALRPRQRRLLGLFASGHSYEEIVATTGDSQRTVDRQLVRARKRLALTAG